MRQERNPSIKTGVTADAMVAAPKNNGHADPLAPQALEALLEALQAMQAGNFSVRLPGSQTGIVGKIADTFNDIIATNQRMAGQLERVGEVVGREGKTR